MTTTMTRAEPTDSPSRAWRAPRRPVLIAIVAVAAITALLWGLRWWGPINPGIGVTWSEATRDWSTVTLQISNQSQSPLTVESVALTRFGSSDVVTSAVPDIEVAPQTTRPVVAHLPDCPSGASAMLAVDVGARNALGWPVTLPATVQVNSCPVEMGVPTTPPPTVTLPAPGIPPADPAAARTGVTQAFWTVYDGSRAAADRMAMIDDPTGIGVAYATAQRPMNDETLRNARADVRTIVFDAPDHAWIDYGVSFGLVPGPSHVGEAVLVDGTWKVTRGTVCQDLILINVTCPT